MVIRVEWFSIRAFGKTLHLLSAHRNGDRGYLEDAFTRESQEWGFFGSIAEDGLGRERREMGHSVQWTSVYLVAVARRSRHFDPLKLLLYFVVKLGREQAKYAYMPFSMRTRQ